MNLESYFRLNFSLIQFHKYSLTEIENMIPWERDVYLNLLVSHVKEENEKTRQRKAEMASKTRSSGR